ncbi:MAG: hypothetical protein Q8K30_04785 [Candidatus Gracilibacteria bacterium]|nr:hypothetical protein [Candidatus Gracilibacteria bacterium]
MINNDTHAYLKDNGYTFEEIEGIKNGINESINGKVISKNKMNQFVKKELFSKYTLNV